MTIPPAPLQSLARAPGRLPHPAAGPAEAAPGGFGAVLTSLLNEGDQLSLNGDHPQSFEQARLLAAWSVPPEGRLAAEMRQGPPKTSASRPPSLPLAAQAMPPHRPTAPSSPAAVLLPQGASGTGDGAAQAATAGATPRRSGAAPAHIATQPLASRPLRAPAASPPRVEALASRASPGGAAPPARLAGAEAALLVRLLNLPEGALLLVRLPALAEAERAALQARVTAMLEGFGRQRHRLIIQEMRGGV